LCTGHLHLHAFISQCSVEMIAEVMRATGVTLDPEYTLKNYLGMTGVMRDNPTALKGTRALYLHTGKTVYCWNNFYIYTQL